MTKSILDVMEEGRKVKGKDASECKELDTAIKEKCRERKVELWKMQCDEIEKEIYRNSPAAHRKVKKLARKKCIAHQMGV